MKNYYKILGVKSSASAYEIKKAYRGLAMQYHPDKNQGAHFAEARFKEIQEAYATLSNSIKRKQYDNDSWLEGVNYKNKDAEVVTPAWLLDIAVRLTQSLEKMDAHRIRQKALQEYILLIVTDAHLGILQIARDAEKNEAVVRQIIKAADYLEFKYLPAIITRLKVISEGNTTLTAEVEAYAKSCKREEFQKRMFPYLVIAVTLALCLFMYFYGNL